MDLLKYNKIPDPFFGSNWEQLKWISQCNAIYTRNISVTDDMLQYQVINIVFEGIDTYSTIKINEK
jgi:beta-mannosidase